jgi:hypothetical protein
MELKEKIALLQAKESKLHSQAVNEKYLPESEKLTRERQKIINEISRLQVERDKEIETEAFMKVKEMVKEGAENKELLLTVNGSKEKIPSNLEIKIKYYPCDHESKIFIPELFREYTFTGDGKKHPISHQRLLARWSSMLGTSSVVNGILTCQQCYQEREEARKRGKRLNIELGKIHWELQIVK